METLGIDFTKLFEGTYYGKRVLITGHTGFKGSWLSLWLHLMGAEVVGYALAPNSSSDHFVVSGLKDKIIDIYGDIRDRQRVKELFANYEPEIVFHLAAQPIVRLSYEYPVETLETNIMGTVNILDCMKASDTVQAGVIITSDKCYENKEQIWGYREEDSLGGFDPYSVSKGCAELITAAYRRSFFTSDVNRPYIKALSSVRAGNVIGGGDWSTDRIIPDCIRALKSDKPIEVRNPYAIRPWQFVLEPLFGYLLLVSKMLVEPEKYSGAWNFGPDFESVVPVNDVVKMMITFWGTGEFIQHSDITSLHEAGLLNLDCTKAKAILGWKPMILLQEAIEQTVQWYKAFESEDVYLLSKYQIAHYCKRVMA